MINDYEIVIATMVANIELTGYNLVTQAACKSWANADFVDRVVVVDGQSVDNTVELIKSFVGPKCEIVVNEIPWPIEKWTWEIIHSMENTAFNYVKSILNPKKLYIFLSSDNVFTDDTIQELHEACNKLIESDKHDYVNLTFQKAITLNFISKKYPLMKGWHVTSITKLNESIQWGEISLHESSIKVNREISGLYYDFKNPAICYDLFCFTKQNILDKLSRHVDSSVSKISIDDFIVNQFLRKLKKLGIKKFEQKNHPSVSTHFIEKLNETHFGYDLFGNVKLLNNV